MTRYIISFMLNGEKHNTTGRHVNPTQEEVEEGKYDRQDALKYALIFISGYMEAKGLTGEVDPKTVEITFIFDNFPF